MKGSLPERIEEIKKAQGLDGTKYRLMFYPAEPQMYWVEVAIDRDWMVMTHGKFRAYRDANAYLDEVTDKNKIEG